MLNLNWGKMESIKGEKKKVREVIETETLRGRHGENKVSLVHLAARQALCKAIPHPVNCGEARRTCVLPWLSQQV